MFDFFLSREDGPSVFHVSGAIIGDDDMDLLKESFAFIQPDDHQIVDHTDLYGLDAGSATMLYEFLVRRSAMAESVVVSSCEGVSMQLVLHDVDRVCPIVPRIEHARDILDRPWAQRRLPH
jgi:hypothetical protein